MEFEQRLEEKRFLRNELGRVAETLEKIDLVGFDADQILIRSEIPVVEEINSMFKTSFQPEDSDWGWLLEFLRTRGYSEPDAQNFDDFIWTDPHILFAAPPVPGGREVHKLLENMGKKAHIITSRVPSLGKITRLWFSEWMFWAAQERIHINADPKRSGAEFKAKKILELGIPIFFEDSHGQAEVILEMTKELKTTVVLVSSKKRASSFNPEGYRDRLIKLPNMLVLHEYLTGNPT